jgi:hypothetical protein
MSKSPTITPVPLSEYGEAIERGFEPGAQYVGDAAIACGDHFQWFVKENERRVEVRILCPTFLRGPLVFSFSKANGQFGAAH